MDHISETITELIGALGPAMALASLAKPVATKAEQRHAAEAIEKLTGEKPTELKFVRRDQEELSDGAEPLILDTYVDEKKHEYWIEPQSGTIVQMGPHAGSYTPTQSTGSAATLTVKDLREKALDIAERQVAGFRQMLSTLHPLEANDRRAVYFFRWEDLSEPLSETELPPFVQVGLYADGSLASFANTLSSYVAQRTLKGGHTSELPESWTKE